MKKTDQNSNKIIDLIDFEEVNKLLEGFNQSTGFVTAILDLEGNVLSKSGWRKICTEFHRIHPDTSRNCTISDTVLANELGNGEKYHFYKCHNGLVDVAVPIVINGEHIANLFSGQFFFDEPDRNFFTKQAQRYKFDESSYLKALDLVPIVSMEKVKVAMDFLLDMTQLISEITFQKLEQIQLNEALKKSEERSRSALDHMLEGCQIIGFDWRYCYLNRTAEIHNRRPNEELIGNRYMDMWPGIENTEVFKLIREVLEMRVPRHFENEFTFPDGRIGWFDLSIQPVPEGVFILSLDITERKKAKLALLESEEKYRLVSDNSDDWIYWMKPDGRIHYVSPACVRVTGYTPEEFTANPELNNEIVYEADKEKVRQHTLTARQDHTPHNIEFRIITKTGELRWLSHSCSPILNDKGDYLGRRATNRNITERKLQEEQLYESEFKFGKLFENSPFGMVIADKAFKFKKVNPAFCSILGYSETELQQFTFKDVTHADDLQKDLANIVKLMNQEIPVYKTEKRYIRKGGHVIWGSLTVTSTYDSEGQFLYNLGIIEDISPRKQAEETLKLLNDRISTATKASQVGIWDWDINNNLLEWDDQMYALYGLKKGEFAGAYEAWLNGLHPDDRESSHNETNLALTGEKVYDTEFRVTWPNGSIHWLKAAGQVFFDEFDKPKRMVGVNFDITDRKQIEMTLQESEEKFRKAFATNPDAITITRLSDGRYVSVNSGFTQIFGFTEEETIGKTPFDINMWYNSDDRKLFVTELKKKGVVANFEAKLCTKYGTLKETLVSATLLEFDGTPHILSTTKDITERKIAERALLESEKKFRALLENIPLPVTYVNKDGEIIFRNNRFLEVIGYAYDEVPTVDEWWRYAYPNADYRQWVVDNWGSVVQKAKENGTDIESKEYNITCKDGLERTMIVSGIIIEDNLLITFIDITDRKKAENEIKVLNETLERRVAERTNQLTEANQELEAFSYSVSHDLRAPLRHINGFVDLLTEKYTDLLPEKGKHYLDVIVDSSNQMGALIDDLLQFSRTGRKEMQEINLDMSLVVHEAINLLKPDIEKRNIEWVIAQLPTIKGDHSLLRMVWQNLLSNAIKFTKAKEKALIQIGYTDNKKDYIFFVRDNGAGFDMRFAHKLFGVFQRLHNSKEFEGTGIGLANVRRIILKHGGRIWAESQLNEGATFYFSLPKH